MQRQSSRHLRVVTEARMDEASSGKAYRIERGIESILCSYTFLLHNYVSYSVRGPINLPLDGADLFRAGNAEFKSLRGLHPSTRFRCTPPCSH